MPSPKDLIHETTTSTGTGTLTLAAVNGRVRFSNATHGFGTGGTDLFDYFISSREASEWERGTGHMSDANTLVRDTVAASSNSDNAVNFSAGVKDVMNDIPADEQVTSTFAITYSHFTPERHGAEGDGGNTVGDGTDDTAAFQAMLAAWKNTGGKIVLSPKIYNISSGLLDGQRTSSATETGVRYEIEGNGALLDFRDTDQTSGSMLKLGATAQANSHENGHFRFNGFTMLGPNATGAQPESGAVATTLVGLNLEWAYNLTLNDVIVRSFFYGARTENCFPILANNVVCWRNIVGLLMRTATTIGTWNQCAFRGGRFGIVMGPTGTSQGVTNQTFINPLLEDNHVGVVMDPGSADSSTGIAGICFENPYFEGITYQPIRIGLQWTEGDATVTGAEAGRDVVGLGIHGGTWSDIGVTNMILAHTNAHRPRNVTILRTPLVSGTNFLTTHFQNMVSDASGAP